MRLQRFFRRAKSDRDYSADIETYVRMETDDNLSRGMSPDAARAAARRKFGNPTLVREEIYTMNTIAFLDTLARDLRYALRALCRNPTFTAVAILTLAIGIGANTAVFTVVNSVLLKPLRYPEPDRLVALRQFAPGAAGLGDFADNLRLSPSMYFTYAEHNRAFQALGVWFPAGFNVTGLAEPEQVRAVMVSAGVLEALAAPPAAGRWLSPADQLPNGPQNVMLTYGYWQRRFGGDNSAIGRNLVVDSQPRQIVGVMPRGFRFLNTDCDLILPLAFDRSKLILAGFGFQGVARLKPGITIAQANADLGRMLPIWMDSWTNGPGTNPHIYETWRITPALRPLKQEVVGNVADVLWAVMATIGVVMLMACANVTNLLLVRAEARQQELAVRAALGAAWGRLVRELLVESVMLGILGGAAGVALALAGLQLLTAIGPANLPRLSEISLDARSLAFTLLLSTLAGLLFGLIPALRYSGPRISIALRGAGRSATVSRERHRTRHSLAIAQIAMAIVLLVSAGLMIRTFQSLRTVDPGFTRPESLQTIRLAIPESLVAEPERVIRMQNEIASKLAAIPGVASVGFASEVPMDGRESSWDAIYAEDKTYPNDLIPPLRMFKFVSPGYFHTAGTRIVAGRDLTWNDVYGRRPVAMISENLAREMWGSPSAAIGKHFKEFPKMPWREVIGVVQDVHFNGVHEKAPQTVYWPTFMDDYFGPGPLTARRAMTFVLRTDRAATGSLLSQAHQAVWSVNSSLPLAAVRTMQDIYQESLARTSFTLVMLAIAAAMALTLGVIGIYGVISYAVSQRTREIGIRLALGAQQAELKTMFVRHGLKLAIAGGAIGLALAVVLTRLMKSLLFGISPLDPVTYAAVPLALIAAALLASYLPARRAAAVDPVQALK